MDTLIAALFGLCCLAVIALGAAVLVGGLYQVSPTADGGFVRVHRLTGDIYQCNPRGVCTRPVLVPSPPQRQA